ncbi:MAG: histidinol dehydrogenase, partial [Flavobacteriales bacterium]|nr:histidinol dehydrogenase [Flavobacteriales bacterium]
MEVIKNPEDWANLLSRPTEESAAIEKTVVEILEAVRTGGDQTILELTQRIDGVQLDQVELEVGSYDKLVEPELKKAISVAKQN